MESKFIFNSKEAVCNQFSKNNTLVFKVRGVARSCSIIASKYVPCKQLQKKKEQNSLRAIACLFHTLAMATNQGHLIHSELPIVQLLFEGSI